MATRRKTELEEERMTDANIAKVIRMLEEPEEGTKPWTKKECCQFLGMAYNTTRLGTILEAYKAKKAKELERRSALRGKPATKDEIAYVVGEYLEGATIDSLSKTTYRPTSFIRKLLEETGVPLRTPGRTYFTPALIPETSSREKFDLNEVVYSARYDSLAVVDKELPGSPEQLNVPIYRLWLLAEKWKQFCYQPAYELASLEHLRAVGVSL